MTELAPVGARERLLGLDVLRGFAMFGVLLANLFVLYSLRFTVRGKPAEESTLDTIAHWFLHLAVEGRAQTLLTFLFGLGFAVQLVRADTRGKPVLPMYLRRIVTLIAIGWFHILVLSWVDVTWGYGLTAFFLLPFIRCSNRTRLVAAAVFTIAPTVLYEFPVREALHGVLFDRPFPVYIEEYAAAARSGDRIDIARTHATLNLLWTLGGGVAWYLPWLLGRFLLGFVAGSQRWFERDGADRLSLFRWMLGAGSAAAAVAITIAVLQQLHVFALQEYDLATQITVAIVMAIGLVGQVAAYVAMVILLLQRPLWRRILGVIAPVGRMPLTTYLMQSLICTTLFYGWGFDWSTPSASECVGLATAIFAFQIVFSHVWLRFLRFGPAEWVWRTAVYLERQPMRR